MQTLNTVNFMKNQAAAHAWPVIGNFMPDFRLPSTEGHPVQTSDYHDCIHDHDRRSLILVFVGETTANLTADHNRTPATGLLLDLALRYRGIVSESTQVFAVVRGTLEEAEQLKQHNHLPFPVLADEDGQVHWDYGAMAPDGRTVCEAVFVVGRYGKVYLSARASDGPPLPAVSGILRSLDFIESRCPECGQDEL